MKKLLVVLLVATTNLWCLALENDPAYLKTSLNRLENDLQKNLEAHSGMRLLDVLQSTNYFYQTLDLFGNQCKDGPFTKLSKLSKTEASALAELDSLVHAYIEGKLNDKDVRITLSTFLNNFTTKTHVPTPNLRHTAIYPYIKGSAARWNITGNFSQLTGDSSVFIMANATVVYPTSKTDSTLSFNIPVSAFVVPGTVTELAMVDLQLNMRYMAGKGKKASDEKRIFYHYVLGLLPDDPGMVKIEKTQSSETEELQHKRTRTFLLNGVKGDLVEKICVPSHTGWTVVPGSIELVVESSTGTKSRDWNYKKTGTGAAACYLVEVFMNSNGPSGKLEYHLKYDITKTTADSASQVNTEDIYWNEERNLVYSPNWVVTYIRPDGIEVKLSAGIHQWPGIEIEVGQENIRINTRGLIEP